MIKILSGANRYKKRLEKQSLQEKYNEYRFVEFNCTDSQVVTVPVIDALVNQSPLFGEVKLFLLLHDFDEFEGKEFLLKLAKSARDRPNLFLVLDTDTKLAANSRIITAAGKDVITYFPEYTTIELQRMCTELLKTYGIKNSDAVSTYLFSRVDPDPYLLENEVAKLSLSAVEGTVTLSSADLLVPVSKKYKIWDFLDKAIKGERNKAAVILLDLLDNGEQEFAILSMIFWNIRIISFIQLFPGQSDETVAEKMRAKSSYPVRQARNLSKRFTLQRLMKLYGAAITVEYRCKTGLIEPKLALLSLCYLF